MKKYLCLLLLANYVVANSQTNIKVPEFNDIYSNYVGKLERGEINIDYQDFRFSFLESKQFIIAKQKADEVRKLENALKSEIEKNNYSQIIKISQNLLSIDYTNLNAHKILRQSYEYTNEVENAARYKVIQFGLLNSIIEKGDGLTCKTGWPVIQISEEYFILRMLDAQLVEQSLSNDRCDEMKVNIDGDVKTYFFNVIKIFEGYAKKP